jgi:hypothetical protein
LDLVCAIASAAMLGIADGKARNIQPIEALWLALLWVTETLLAAMQFGHNWHIRHFAVTQYVGRFRTEADTNWQGRSAASVANDPCRTWRPPSILCPTIQKN